MKKQKKETMDEQIKNIFDFYSGIIACLQDALDNTRSTLKNQKNTLKNLEKVKENQKLSTTSIQNIKKDLTSIHTLVTTKKDPSLDAKDFELI